MPMTARIGLLRANYGSRWEPKRTTPPLDIHWDNCNAAIAAVRPLREIVEDGSTISQQAELLADWAYQSIQAALRLPPLPSRR
jgi:hypothetical protein